MPAGRLRQKGERLAKAPNPYGAIGKDPAKAALRRFGQKEFTRIIEMALTANIEGLRAIIKDPATSALKAGIAMALLKAVKHGDWKTLEGIAERIVGKVKVSVDHTSKGAALGANAPQQVILYIPANNRTKEEQDDGAGF